MSGHGGGGGGGRRKRGGGHGGGGGGHGDARFLVTYADLLTVLMALFLVLWVLATIDLNKFKKFTQGLGDFGNPAAQTVDNIADASPGETAPPDTTDTPTQGSAAPGAAATGACGEATATTAAAADGAETSTTAAPSTTAADGADTSDTAAAAPAADCAGGSGTGTGTGTGDLTSGQLQQVAQTLQGDLTAAGIPAGETSIHVEARGLIVTISTDGVLFGSGDTKLTQPGRDILAAVAPGLRAIPNKIVVEGHTDKRPLARTNYDNWNLSVDRAISVLRFLSDDLGVPAERLAATGYGEFRPVDPGDTPEALAKNRRVEIVVVAKSEAGATTASDTPTTAAAAAEGATDAAATTAAPKTKSTTTQTTTGG